MSDRKMRVMAVMPHQDDFEFNAGGTFALLHKTLGDAVDLKVLCTTRGATGHHTMTVEETFRRRGAEAAASASLVGAEYECMTALNGAPLPGQMTLDPDALGGLWNAIRGFQADVVFCPPVVTDPLAGVHIDHIRTAWAVRLVAYQIVVPNAYPTMNAPRLDYVPQPLIINVHDTYTSEAGEDHIRQDITEVFETKVKMGLCHESQIFEWLPFANNTEPPTREQWTEKFRARHTSQNEAYGYDDETMSEFFRVTRWGRRPREGELETLFPKRMT